MDTTNVRVNLLDVWIDRIDLQDACRFVDTCIRRGTPHQVATVNLDFLRLCRRDRSFHDAVNASALVLPDGMPLVWASRLQGEPLPERVAGVDVVMECARLAAEKGHRMFLLGAGPGVAEAAATVMRQRFPALRIVGTHSPPSLSHEDDMTSIALVRQANPDILLVAFGAPRQELWIRKHLQALDVPVCIGVGGSFDMISGRLSRAPQWMRHGGMEWFYRFILEPKRLWKRYFVQDLPMLLRLIAWSTAPSPHPAAPISFSPLLAGGEVAVSMGQST